MDAHASEALARVIVYVQNEGSLEIFAATTVDRRVMATDPSGPSPF
jgi:hypothetical protein